MDHPLKDKVSAIEASSSGRARLFFLALVFALGAVVLGESVDLGTEEMDKPSDVEPKHEHNSEPMPMLT